MFIHFGKNPLTVKLDQESIDALTRATVKEDLVPGDIVDKDNPINIGPVDISGYTSISVLVHAENISQEPVQFYMNALQGPIGSKDQVETIAYNRPMEPGMSFEWRTAGTVYANNLYANFWVTGDGQVDVFKSIVKTAATATCCP